MIVKIIFTHILILHLLEQLLHLSSSVIITVLPPSISIINKNDIDITDS